MYSKLPSKSGKEKNHQVLVLTCPNMHDYCTLEYKRNQVRKCLLSVFGCTREGT